MTVRSRLIASIGAIGVVLAGSLVLSTGAHAAAVTPVAVNDEYTTAHLTVLTVDAVDGILANDTGVSSFIAQVQSGPTSGFLSLNTDGSFSFDPQTNHGVDVTFTYCIYSDALSACQSNVATVIIHVTGATAVADSYTIAHDTTLTVADPGVLSNDIGVGLNDTAALQSDVSHGSLSLQSDGSFVYTPDAGYTGVDEFQYCIEFEGGCGTNIVTDTITMTPSATTTSPTNPPSSTSSTPSSTAPTPTGSTTGSGNLADTGTNSAGLLWAAAVLLLGGVTLLLLGQRRRLHGGHRAH
jgi:hypothetical protein